MEYDDQARSQFMSAFVTGLQAYYEWTLLADVDEIVIPNPNSKSTFFELLENSTNQVIVSKGFDVVQMVGEPDFLFDETILNQRYFAIPNLALCKPHLAKIPIQYSVGYHYCNHKLSLASDTECFFTLHLKFACQQIRKELRAVVLETSYANEKTASYAINNISDDFINSRVTSLLKRPIEHLDSIKLREFETNYEKDLLFNRQLGLWIGKHAIAPFLVHINGQITDKTTL